MIKTLWFFGLSGAGKSTLADIAAKHLREKGIITVRLDGDHVREGLCKGLGYNEEGRMENIRRAASVARLLNDQGIFVVASFMTPRPSMQQKVYDIVGDVELMLCCSDQWTCQERDPKGLYAKAKKGLIGRMVEAIELNPMHRAYNAPRIDTEVPLEMSIGEVIQWLQKNILSSLADGILCMKDTSTSSGRNTTNYSYQSSSW